MKRGPLAMDGLTGLPHHASAPRRLRRPPAVLGLSTRGPAVGPNPQGTRGPLQIDSSRPRLFPRSLSARRAIWLAQHDFERGTTEEQRGAAVCAARDGSETAERAGATPRQGRFAAPALTRGGRSCPLCQIGQQPKN